MPHHVILCDDQAPILCAAATRFQREGFRVRCAQDGQEALQLIGDERPDVLVTDLQMPRMDGLSLVERLRQSEGTRELPVVLLTAKGFELSNEEVCAKYQISRIMTKPFSPRELVEHVRTLIDDSSASQPLATTTESLSTVR